MLANCAILWDTMLYYLNNTFHLDDPEILINTDIEDSSDVYSNLANLFQKRHNTEYVPYYSDYTSQFSDDINPSLPAIIKEGVLKDILASFRSIKTNLEKRKKAQEDENNTVPDYEYEVKFRNGKEYLKLRKGRMKMDGRLINVTENGFGVGFLSGKTSQFKFGNFRKTVLVNGVKTRITEENEAQFQSIPFRISKRRKKMLENNDNQIIVRKTRVNEENKPYEEVTYKDHHFKIHEDMIVQEEGANKGKLKKSSAYLVFDDVGWNLVLTYDKPMGVVDPIFEDVIIKDGSNSITVKQNKRFNTGRLDIFFLNYFFS